ncbi:MAG: aminotransferase, partial [Saprospiraceae bacterium]|nr:aminotransferase [Saprospiraceae bacterium]
MLENQKALFSLDDSITFLNAAYMSPQLKYLSEFGAKQLVKKDKPYQFQTEDFFEPRTELKKSFASLILASDYRSVAIIHS